MEKLEIIIISLIVLIIVISIIYCYIKIDISFYDIKNKKIDKNIKIMFLSDLHNRKFYKKLEFFLDKYKPDIIICGGDMVNEDMKFINNFVELTKLFNNYKTYYTFGNHEEKMKSYKKYVNLIEKKPLVLLNNKKDNLSKNILIYGLENKMDTYHSFGKLGLSKKYIESKLGVFDDMKYNILIAHNPIEFVNYVSSNADLVLCGHVHGGLIRIPFLGPLLSPDNTFFPKYGQGLHKKNNTTMIVSRGLGFSRKIPIRINNAPEVVIINLIKDE